MGMLLGKGVRMVIPGCRRTGRRVTGWFDLRVGNGFGPLLGDLPVPGYRALASGGGGGSAPWRGGGRLAFGVARAPALPPPPPPVPPPDRASPAFTRSRHRRRAPGAGDPPVDPRDVRRASGRG